MPSVLDIFGVNFLLFALGLALGVELGRWKFVGMRGRRRFFARRWFEEVGYMPTAAILAVAVLFIFGQITVDELVLLVLLLALPVTTLAVSVLVGGLVTFTFLQSRMGTQQ